MKKPLCSLFILLLLSVTAHAYAESISKAEISVTKKPQTASVSGASDKTLSADLKARIDKAVDEAVRKALGKRETEGESKPEETKTDSESSRQSLKYVESNVISLVGREGFRWQDKQGNFLLNPYFLLQTRFQMWYVDDEGLNLADPDNVQQLGFGIPNAILGFAGKAFGVLSFNLALNGACAGKACLLNQIWLEGNVTDEFRIRVGKFKTPMHWTLQSRVGQKLAPFTPYSLTSAVNIPFDINAVNPSMLSGFDLGVMMHGNVADRFQYQVGVFNGEGIGVNVPTSTMNDDWNIPALMYSARVAYTPFGSLPLQEGGSETDDDLHLLVALSTSYNVEANAETSNDLRAGAELVLSKGGWYWASEFYLMNMDFVERQRNAPSYLFLGGYTGLAYAFDIGLEPFGRFDMFDRNSTDDPGVLLMPGVGLNWYAYRDNLKLQAMYQYLAKAGHDTEFDANDDDNGMPEHVAMIQLQFAL